MAPGYLNFQTTYPIDLNEAHQPLIFTEDHQYTPHLSFHMNNSNNNNPLHHLQAASSSSPTTTSSSSTFNPTSNCPIYFFNQPQDPAGYSFGGSQFQPYPFKQEVDDNNYGSIGSSSSYDQSPPATTYNNLEMNNKKEDKDTTKFSISKNQERSSIFLTAGDEVDTTTYLHQTFNQVQISTGGGRDTSLLSSDQWMSSSSNMRLVKKKMMNKEGDDDVGNNHNTNNEQLQQHKSGNKNNNCIDSNTIRVCADCNTTKTPLWRSGPKGPKTLCNACGIRQRKARRAMAAAANNSSSAHHHHHHMSTIRAAPGGNHIHYKTLSNYNYNYNYNNNNGFGSGAQKKRSKLTNKTAPPPPQPPPRTSTLIPLSRNSNSNSSASGTDDFGNGRRKSSGSSSTSTPSSNCFEEFATSLSKKLSLDQQVLFPDEEREAAILLMAISCGLIHG